jgi:allantoinase
VPDPAQAAYPRDLVGYAGRPPDPRWPGGARVAINLVVNLEEGGERSILHGDATAEARLTDLAPAPPLVGARDLNMESAYEYGSRVGIWRIIRLFAERGIPFTTYAVGMAMERTPRVVEALAAAGCDWVDHGYRWFDYAAVDEATEREHMQRGLDLFRRMLGQRPEGFYIGTPSLRTRPMRVAEGGFLYDSDDYSDDLPHWLTVSGKKHLVIPHTLTLNDTRLARGLGWGQASDFTATLIDAFDARYAEGNALMTVALHARLIGLPERMMHFRHFLDHVARHDRVWIARRGEIARHWMTEHPV